ncbi:MAG: hypothetical protein ACRD1Z_08775, partial [Vicinamibacteria bacterium]
VGKRERLLNPALERLNLEMERLFRKLRTNLNKPAGSYWKSWWRTMAIAHTQLPWHSKEAANVVKEALLMSGSMSEDLPLYLTAYLNGAKSLEEIDKPDSLVAEYARSFLTDNHDLLAEVILSGGDE